MKRGLTLLLTMMILVILSSCAVSLQNTEVVPDQDETMETDEISVTKSTENGTEKQSMTETYTTKTEISDVMNDPVFNDYGRLIFPVDSVHHFMIPCMERVRQFPIIRRL